MGEHEHSKDGLLRMAVVDPSRPGPLSRALLAEATSTLRKPEPGVRAVLITHPGPNFCVGGDVGAFAAAADPGTYVRQLASSFHEFVEALIAYPVPVVVGVQGWAAGAGFSIVLACDVVVIGRGTRMRPAYPGIGFSPDGGMSWMLPRIIGRARAMDVLLTDRVLSAADAESFGIASRVVDDADVGFEAEAIALRLGSGPTSSLGRIKALVQAGATSGLVEHLAAEAESIGACAESPAGREGVAAFLGRRPPVFG